MYIYIITNSKTYVYIEFKWRNLDIKKNTVKKQIPLESNFRISYDFSRNQQIFCPVPVQTDVRQFEPPELYL